MPKNLHSATGPVTSQTLESQTNRIIQVTKQSVVKSEHVQEVGGIGTETAQMSVVNVRKTSPAAKVRRDNLTYVLYITITDEILKFSRIYRYCFLR